MENEFYLNLIQSHNLDEAYEYLKNSVVYSERWRERPGLLPGEHIFEKEGGSNKRGDDDGGGGCCAMCCTIVGICWACRFGWSVGSSDWAQQTACVIYDCTTHALTDCVYPMCRCVFCCS